MDQLSRDYLFRLIAQFRQRAEILLGGRAAGAEALPALIEPPVVGDARALRLPALAQTFALSPGAVSVLVCLAAAEYDPLIRLLARSLQRDLGRPWLELGTVAELCGIEPHELPDLARLCDAGGELGGAALVLVDDAGGGEIPVVSRRVKVAERVARYLAGDDLLPETSRLVAPAGRGTETLVPAARVDAVVARARRALQEDAPLTVAIAGPHGCGKRRFAERLAEELGQPLLIVDLALIETGQLARAIADGTRDAALAGALLCLANLDAGLGRAPLARDEHGAPPPSDEQGAPPRALPAALRRLLAQPAGVVCLTMSEREPLLEAAARALVHVSVPFPSPSQRARLLGEALAAQGAQLAADVDLTVAARRFALHPGRIARAARDAFALARERDGDGAVGNAELAGACRAQLRHDLGSIASRVTTSHRWQDLVVPVDVYHGLDEMIAYMRHAERVYDTWGFGSRHSLTQGLSALFAGPPGTGKTMCASVMARELDMELFQVDLSRVVSKWIGETEKNLAKIFDEAQRSNAIVLFDEADALFSKRTEVKSSVDRYANLEVNFLLQRMEQSGGVTILTTNFEDSIDPAFKRRLTFRLRFERPDAEARTALWSKVFPAGCALADDISAERLGRMYEMSGAHIRNAAVRAAFLAAAEGAPIDMRTCMVAAERECREMGLLVRSHLEHEVEPGERVAAAPPPLPARPQPPVPAVTPAPRRAPARLVPITHPR